MGERATAELGVQPPQSWRALLVSINKYEYSQDRLRREIADLKFELDQMQLDHQRQRNAAMVAEVIICITVFMAGYAMGRFW